METSSQPVPNPLQNAVAFEAASSPAPMPGGPPAVSSNREIAKVQADYFALSNDLEQAQALANTLELQLSGKTNELASFKAICERTQEDLARFERDIQELRKERHNLANQAQRAVALEFQLEKLQRSSGEMKARAERAESELTAERLAHTRTRAELQEAFVHGDARGGGPAQPLAQNLALRSALEAVRQQIEAILAEPCSPVWMPRPRGVEQPPIEHIEISYER